MKQQTRHNKTEKDLFDTLYSWIILVVFVICFLDMRIEEEMICNFTWWYLFFAIAGFIAGIICLFRYEKIKERIYNRLLLNNLQIISQKYGHNL